MERRANLTDRTRWVRRLVGRVETAEVRWFGRSIVSVVARQQVLVLTTTGRRSGKVRRTTVAYTEVGGQIVVVGGAAGQTRPPDWVANLAADPLVEVTIRRATAPMRAMVLVGDARRRVWDAVLPRWPFIANYEARAGYEIAVVVLEPVPPG